MTPVAADLSEILGILKVCGQSFAVVGTQSAGVWESGVRCRGCFDPLSILDEELLDTVFRELCDYTVQSIRISNHSRISGGSQKCKETRDEGPHVNFLPVSTVFPLP